MKAIIFSDLHIQLKNREVALECLRQIEQIALSRNIQNIFHLGDLLNDKSLIRSEVFRESFYFLKNSSRTWTLLVGNHDYESIEANDHHTLELFRELSNVRIIDRFTVKDSFVYAPFYRREEELISWLKDFKFPTSRDNGPRIFFGHQGVNGFSYSSSYVDSGIVKKEHFKRFDRVFLGHIHKPQEEKNIVYVGSPFTQSFGESGEDKRILIVDFDTLETEEILLNLPKHVVLNLNCDSSFQVTSEAISSCLVVGDKNDYVKIIVKAPKEILSRFNKSLFADRYNNLIIQKQEVESSKKIKILETSSYSQMVKTYIDTIETVIPKQDLYQLNEEILEEIQNAGT